MHQPPKRPSFQNLTEKSDNDKQTTIGKKKYYGYLERNIWEKFLLRTQYIQNIRTELVGWWFD
jgi:hypothetical protein